MLLLGSAAGASAMTVNTTADSAATAGQCSLRDAITAVENGNGNTACGSLASSGPTTIILPAGTYALDQGAGELHITGSANVAIVGADPSHPGSTTIDAQHYSRVFEVDPQAQLSLSALEVTNGRSPNGVTPTKPGVYGGIAPDGGGILNHGRLTLDHVTVTGNSTGFGGTGAQGVQPAGCGQFGLASGDGGPGGSGGGIANESGATLTVTDSLISGNATGDGGAGANGIDGVGALCESAGGGAGGRGAQAGMGGGIYNAGVSTILDTTIDSNATGRGGIGGTGGRGAGATQGNGTVSDPGTPGGTGGNGGAGGNEGAVYGNGVNNDPVLAAAAGGGGIANSAAGRITLTGSTVSNNNTGAGGNGGGAGNGGPEDSTRSEDSGHGGQGGGGGLGGGLFSNGDVVTLTNDTFTDNLTGDGGLGGNGGDNADASLGSGNGGFGGYGGAIWTSEDTQNGVQAVVTMTNLTIAANQLGAGGAPGSDPKFVGLPGGRGLGAALLNYSTASNLNPGVPGSALTETNTLIASNGARNLGDTNCGNSSAISDGGGNLDFSGNVSVPDTTCPGINADPMLGALTANGGPTLTMLPAVGSPALNVASCAETTDQRGEPRPETGGSACDIGAVERQPVENGGGTGGGTGGTGGGGSTGGGTGGAGGGGSTGGGTGGAGGGGSTGGGTGGTGGGGSTGGGTTGTSGGGSTGGGTTTGSTGSGTSSGGSTGSGTSTGGSTGGGGTTGAGSTATPTVTIRTSIVFGRITSSGAKVTVVISCRGGLGATCPLKLKLTGEAVYRGAKLIGFAPQQAGRGKTRRKVVTLDGATVTLRSGQSRSVTLVLDGLGRRQLALQDGLEVSLVATQASGARTTTLLSRKLHLSAK